MGVSVDQTIVRFNIIHDHALLAVLAVTNSDLFSDYIIRLFSQVSCRATFQPQARAAVGLSSYVANEGACSLRQRTKQRSRGNRPRVADQRGERHTSFAPLVWFIWLW